MDRFVPREGTPAGADASLPVESGPASTAEGLPLRRERVACVELPDDAAGVVIQLYCDGATREAAVIVSTRPDSHAARIGELLGVPVHKRATREALVHCDSVVVGDPSPEAWTNLTQLTAGLEVRLLPLDRVLELAGEPTDDPVSEPATEPAVVAADAELVPFDPNPPGSLPDEEFEPFPELIDPGPGYAGETPPLAEEAFPPEARHSADPPKPWAANPVGAPDPAMTAAAPAPESEPEAPRESQTRGTLPVDARVSRAAEDEFPGVGIPFHAASLLGAAAGSAAGILWIDPQEPRIGQLLDDVLTATGARTASLMLLDVDGERLKPLAARGRGADAILESRPRVDHGLVGHVFATRAPEIHHGTTPCLAEEEDRTRRWIAAGHPLVVDGATLGVLCINGEYDESPVDAEIHRVLRSRSADACAAVLSAVRIDRIEAASSRTALQCLVDRLMAVEEALPSRLALVAEALRKALGADYVQAYTIDALRGSLVPIMVGEGAFGLRKRELSLARGMLGWVVRHGAPQVFELRGRETSDAALSVCYPVASTHPHSLLFLENIPLQTISREMVLQLLGDIVEQVEGMIAVEEAMSLQDLVADLDMRIADHSAELANLPPELRTQALLELALELTTAEAAVWQPRPGAAPTMSRPGTRRSAATLLEAWNQLEVVTAEVRAAGTSAAGFRGDGCEVPATQCTVPFVGVRDGDREGVLIVFYSPSELMGAPAQVPLHVLWKTLRSLCERIPREDRGANAPATPSGERHGDESGWLGAARFAETVRYEQSRSRRSGRPFAVTRLRVDPARGPAAARALRRLLNATRGEIDLLCEVGAAAYVVLWPEPAQSSDEQLAELERHWQMAQPEIPLECEQLVLSGASDDPDRWLEWLGEAAPGPARSLGASDYRNAA